MIDHQENRLSIWFFIGAMVLVYGLLISGAGVYGWMNPPAPEVRVQLWPLHADVWWGMVLLVIGLFYTLKFWPKS